MDKNLALLGENIRSARKNMNKTQDEFVSCLPTSIYIDRKKLGRFESGAQAPKIDELYAIATALNTTMINLLGGSSHLKYADTSAITGLNDNAIKRLDIWKEQKPENIEMLNLILERNNLAILFSIIYLYISNPITTVKKINKITGKQEDVDVKEKRTMLSSSVVRNLSVILNSIAEEYSPIAYKDVDKAINILLHESKQKEIENEVSRMIDVLEREQEYLESTENL